MTAQTVDTRKLWDMIKDIRFGMLTVHGADGRLYARPMTTQNGEADRGGVIWFFMLIGGQIFPYRGTPLAEPSLLFSMLGLSLALMSLRMLAISLRFRH